MRYFKVSFFAITFIFLGSLISTASADDSLIGIWVSSGQSRGGLRSVLEYKSNGEVISTMRVMLAGNFSLKDNRLTLQFDEEKNSADLKAVVKNDQLTISNLEGKESVELKRIPMNSGVFQKNINGSWTGQDQDGGSVSYIFRSDGRVLYQKPMPGYTSSQYVINGNKVETYRDGKKQGTAKYSVNGDTLNLISDGKDYLYVRGGRN